MSGLGGEDFLYWYQEIHRRTAVVTSSCRTPLSGPQLAAMLPGARVSTQACPSVGSASGLDAAHDLGGEFGVGQQLVDERDKDLLSGDAGESEAVGDFSLPDVEGSVSGG
jgi:hypothetical protein